MTVDIFKSFQEAINVGIFVVVAGFIVILIFIIAKVKEWYNYKENERKNKEKISRNTDEIIEASKKWSTQVKISNCNYFSEEYERLRKCQEKPVGAGYATSTIITVYINGKMQYYDMDIDGLYTIYNYLKNDIDGKHL